MMVEPETRKYFAFLDLEELHKGYLKDEVDICKTTLRRNI